MRAPRLLTSLAVIVAAASVAVGCGTGGGSSSGVIPERSALVVELDIRRGKDGGSDRARAVLGRVPAWQLAEQRLPEPQTMLDQLLVSVGAKPSLEWDEEVEPWLGDRAGLAGWLDDADKPSFSLVAWIDATDEERAKDAMEQAVGTEQDGSFEGTELFRGTGELEDVFWAVHEQRVLLGNGKGSVTAALRAADGESLDDGDAWDRLRGERGGDALMSVYGTPELTEQIEELTKAQAESGDGSDEESEQALEQVQQSIEQWRGSAREFAFHMGSDDDGLWFDTIAVGENEPIEPDADAPGARELLERLPEQTAAGAAWRAGGRIDDETAEMARTQLEQYEQMLGEGEVSPAVADLFGLAESFVSPDVVELMDEAYRGDVSLGLTNDEGRLSVVGGYGVQDEDSALELEAMVVERLREYLGKHTRVKVRSEPVKDGTRVVVSGIPAQQAVAAIARGTSTPIAKVRQNPLVERFLRPQLVYEVRTAREGEQVYAFPADAIDLAAAAHDGEGTLADSARYQRDLETIDVPDDAAAMYWMDVREVLQPIVEPLSGQAWVLVNNQLDHVGGPIGWGIQERDGEDTVSRSVIEIPLYD